MEFLRKVTDKHDMIALLPEKPFTGVNSSENILIGLGLYAIIPAQIILNLRNIRLRT
jgi:hypothetical protein